MGVCPSYPMYVAVEQCSETHFSLPVPLYTIHTIQVDLAVSSPTDWCLSLPIPATTDWDCFRLAW